MRIVQSLWSKPFNIAQSGRFNGGWLSEKYNYISWTLSLLLLRKHYGEVNLVTDTNGYTFLIERLNLPYDSVSLSLDCLSDCPESMWAMGKIYTYAIQDKAFMHVDGDVFLWQPLDKSILKSDLFCQNLEVDASVYNSAFDLLETNGFVLTTDLLKRTDEIAACNAGVIGGINRTIWKELYDDVLLFLQNNEARIRSVADVNVLNIILEQVLVFKIAAKHGIKPAVVFDSDVIRSELDILVPASIEKATFGMQYNHLLGISKKDPFKLRIMERMLQLNYPKYYYRILDLLN
jgi:hypothetical protein